MIVSNIKVNENKLEEFVRVLLPEEYDILKANSEKNIYFEIFETKSEALKREIKIKKMNRLRKEKLVLNFDKSKFSTYMEGDV